LADSVSEAGLLKSLCLAAPLFLHLFSFPVLLA
jgi:hypothetical protein